MNAITQTAPINQASESKADDLETLQRLIELGRQLAERAASQALEQATSQTPEQAAQQAPRLRRDDPSLIFFRLARFISDTIILKARLAAGILFKAKQPRREPAPSPTPAAAEAPTAPEDPRRRLIIRYVRETIALTHRKRKTTITPQQIETQVDAELANDPNRRLPGHSLLLKICKSLDVPFHANRLPIDLLRPPRPIDLAPTLSP